MGSKPSSAQETETNTLFSGLQLPAVGCGIVKRQSTIDLQKNKEISKGLRFTRDGKCDYLCSSEYKPVCGLNGMTYHNKCIADALNEPINTNISEGKPCESYSRLTNDCDGRDGYNPVCSMTNSSHFNKCHFDRLSKDFSEKARTLKHEGLCKKSDNTSELSYCSDTFANTMVVCTTENEVFTSECMAKYKNKDVHYFGECKGEWSVYGNRIKLGKIDCSKEIIDPVCGDNNETYINTCEAVKRGQRVKYLGVCKDVDPTPHISCDPVRNIVCGNDNKSYANQCIADKYTNGVKHYGLCVEDIEKGIVYDKAKTNPFKRTAQASTPQ